MAATPRAPALRGATVTPGATALRGAMVTPGVTATRGATVTPGVTAIRAPIAPLAGRFLTRSRLTRNRSDSHSCGRYGSYSRWPAAQRSLTERPGQTAPR